MQCGSCVEVIPDDSIFCPECGARQEMSHAGGFTSHNAVGLGGQDVSGGRSFGVVSGEAVRQQRDAQVGAAGNIPTDVMQQIAQGIQNQQNFPPGSFPPQGIPQNQQLPPQGMPQNQQLPPQGIPQNQQFPPQNQFPPMNTNDIPSPTDGHNIGNGAMPTRIQDESEAVGSIIGVNPNNSPTDQMVNRLAEAERAMKNERRSQWLNMNQSSATNVLANLGTELPAHLRQEQVNPAANIMAGAMGQSAVDGPSEALLRRICEVAVRRVARKRGVAVETPQSSADEDQLNVTVTYVDDGRVLDTPEDLAQAFEHSIQTELALKGYDFSTNLSLFCSKEGEIEKLIGQASEEVEEEEEMFACEICDGLVKDSDNECPHCGAMFEDEDSGGPKSGPPGPSGPSRGGPPGPSKSGGPPGPSRGGSPKSGGPPGPSKSGGPSGPSRGGPPKSGGPSGPSKSGGPPKGGPKGPKRGGPPR